MQLRKATLLVAGVIDSGTFEVSVLWIGMGHRSGETQRLSLLAAACLLPYPPLLLCLALALTTVSFSHTWGSHQHKDTTIPTHKHTGHVILSLGGRGSPRFHLLGFRAPQAIGKISCACGALPCVRFQGHSTHSRNGGKTSPTQTNSSFYGEDWAGGVGGTGAK